VPKLASLTAPAIFEPWRASICPRATPPPSSTTRRRVPRP